MIDSLDRIHRMPRKGPGYSGRNLQEPAVTEFKLRISPSVGIEVGYFLLGASLAKLAMIKRYTNPSFIAICILNCAEHLFRTDLVERFWAISVRINRRFFAANENGPDSFVQIRSHKSRPYSTHRHEYFDSLTSIK